MMFCFVSKSSAVVLPLLLKVCSNRVIEVTFLLPISKTNKKRANTTRNKNNGENEGFTEGLGENEGLTEGLGKNEGFTEGLGENEGVGHHVQAT